MSGGYRVFYHSYMQCVYKFVLKTGIPKSKPFITYCKLLSKKIRPVCRIARKPSHSGLYHLKLCGALTFDALLPR